MDIDPGYNGFADTNKLLATASNGPDAARQWTGLAQQQQQLSQQQFELAKSRLDSFHQLSSSILADPSAQNANQTVMDAVHAGTIPADMGNRALTQMSSMNDDQRKQFAFQQVMTLANHDQALQAAYGAPALVDQGGKLSSYMVRTGAQGGYTPAQNGVAAIPKTISPSDKIARVNVIDPTTGAGGSTSNGQLYDDQGNFRGAAAQPGAGGPGAVQAPANTVNGNAPGAARVANTVSPQQPPAANSGASGTLPTSLSPGAQAAMEGSANSWKSLAADVASPSGVNQRVYTLEQALGALRNTSTGIGTAGRQKLLSYIAALPGGVGKYIAGDPDKLSDYDLANKYLTSYALNTPGAARSDAGLDTAGAANASTTINPKAAQEVTLSNIGLERMKQAQARAFIDAGQDPGQFSNWSTKWNQNLDPKAFALGSMTPAERASLYSGLKGKALTGFNNSIRVGLKTGVLTRDDLAGATGNGQQ